MKNRRLRKSRIYVSEIGWVLAQVYKKKAMKSECNIDNMLNGSKINENTFLD